MDLPGLDNPPIVIRESRWKSGLAALGTLMVAVLFVTNVARSPKANDTVLLLLMAAAGFVAVCGIIEAIRPSTLILDPSGFTIRQFWRTRHLPWRQVSNFRVRYSRGGRYVVYDAPAAVALFGSGQLPVNWAMSPPDLAMLMNQCQERWAAGGPPSSVSPVSIQPTQRREPTVT